MRYPNLGTDAEHDATRAQLDALLKLVDDPYAEREGGVVLAVDAYAEGEDFRDYWRMIEVEGAHELPGPVPG